MAACWAWSAKTTAKVIGRIKVADNTRDGFISGVSRFERPPQESGYGPPRRRCKCFKYSQNINYIHYSELACQGPPRTFPVHLASTSDIQLRPPQSIR